LPRCDAVIESANGSTDSAEVCISICVDWTTKPDQQAKLFLNLARGGATACRLLATTLHEATANTATEGSQLRDPHTQVTSSQPMITLRRPESIVSTARSDIDQHVERAFDLLAHYQGFVCRIRLHSEGEEDEDPVPPRLEATLKEWLPKAAAADCKLINDALAVVGDNDAAANLLRDANLPEARHACLDRLACEAIPLDVDLADAAARCLIELENWRSVLPPTTLGASGQQAVQSRDKITKPADGFYWDCDLTARPSRTGASFSLGLACDAVAHAASREDVIKSELRPLVKLALRLREQPDWTRLLLHNIAAIVDPQIQLADEVELLIRELSLPKKVEQQRARATATTKNGRTRPKADAIDEVAKTCLMTALAAGRESGEHYVPTRLDMAKAVSKQLNHKIGVSSLFATKEEQGNRAHRYPKFMEFWRQTQKQIKGARQSRAKRSREA